MAQETFKSIPSYSQIACVGTGISAIALGATLKRWYQLDDIRFFERNDDCGGTWHINSYPGCACDIPSALYSFSFAPNPRWSKLMPSYEEIKAYQQDVANQYGLREKMVFSTEVKKCIWRADASRWLIELCNVNTHEISYHECQILFGATGVLVEPRPCDIPGASTFNGSIFHSARWNHGASLEGKKVVVIGNGCTAAQIVPAIMDKSGSVTQVIRSQHWVVEALNFTYPKAMLWAFEHIPLAQRLHRFAIYLAAEQDWKLFPMTKASAKYRQKRRKEIEAYMRKKAPAKYHDILIPEFEVGCKRRIFDCGYLDSLHNDKYLLTDAKILEIVPEGLVTSNGLIPADVIVLATGFDTNRFLPGMQVHGRNETTVDEHWSRQDGPGAYNTSAMNGFPNFFMLLGPNTVTGHTSAIMASENSVNYALRVLKPVLDGSAASVEVKAEAEDKYIEDIQATLKNTVWHLGCTSWYVNGKSWNALGYPWTQAHFWYRSLFPVWKDWDIKWVQKPASPKWKRLVLALLLVISPSLYRSRLQRRISWFMGIVALLRQRVGL
ncbi:flavin-containing monooxygenase [Aspergillus lucknowensis]|uniref:L-ornithine N(5)-oxygenase n=1 Tax=Aspergillus lucknowensis TaxID=176173 RepID=A0ABR4LG97_9EURO